MALTADPRRGRSGAWRSRSPGNPWFDPGDTVVLRYLAQRFISWFLMIVVATNLTYFLAAWFLDPRANYLQLRPPRTPEQIDRALAQDGLSPPTPALPRGGGRVAGIVLHWNWGYSPVGEAVNGQVAFRIGVSAQLV